MEIYLQLIYRLCHFDYNFVFVHCLCFYHGKSWETISQQKGTLCSTMNIFLCHWYTLAIHHFKIEISNPHAKYQESWSNASLRLLHFPRHIYKSWLILPQLPPMRTWRPFCIQKSAKNRWPQNLWRTYAHEYKVCMLTSSVISAQAFLFLFLVLHAFSLKNLSPFFF